MRLHFKHLAETFIQRDLQTPRQPKTKTIQG